jgi:hypothetical protein
MQEVSHTRETTIRQEFQRTITEAGNPVKGGHADDKREEIVNERVECLVHKGLPWHVCHTLQLVVDKQLRRHHNEP